MTVERAARVALALTLGVVAGVFLLRAGATVYRIDGLDIGSAITLVIAAGLVFFAGIFISGALSALRGSSRSLGWLLLAALIALIAVSPFGYDLGLWGLLLIAAWLIAVGAHLWGRIPAASIRDDGRTHP